MDTTSGPADPNSTIEESRTVLPSSDEEPSRRPGEGRSALVGLVVVGVVAITVVLAAALFWTARSASSEPVAAGGRPDAAPLSRPVVVNEAAADDGGLIITPATGLLEGQEVGLSLAESADVAGQSALLAQCSSEVTELVRDGGDMSVLDWCSVIDSLDGRAASDLGTVRVRRIVDTSTGQLIVPNGLAAACWRRGSAG